MIVAIIPWGIHNTSHSGGSWIKFMVELIWDGDTFLCCYTYNNNNNNNNNNDDNNNNNNDDDDNNSIQFNSIQIYLCAET
jgi:hypothetical protein